MLHERCLPLSSLGVFLQVSDHQIIIDLLLSSSLKTYNYVMSYFEVIDSFTKCLKF